MASSKKDRAKASSKIRRKLRSLSKEKIRSALKKSMKKGSTKEREKQIATTMLAKDNKESLEKTEKKIEKIQDALKDAKGNDKKSNFLRNVLLVSLLGVSTVTAYGMLDDIKKKLKEVNNARKQKKLYSYAKSQLPSRPKSFSDVTSGTKRRASYVKDSFLRGGQGVYSGAKNSPYAVYDGVRNLPSSVSRRYARAMNSRKHRKEMAKAYRDAEYNARIQEASNRLSKLSAKNAMLGRGTPGKDGLGFGPEAIARAKAKAKEREAERESWRAAKKASKKSSQSRRGYIRGQGTGRRVPRMS